MTKRTTGIVLCGGLSQRMGKDKGGLILNGKTLLENAVSCLINSGVSNVYTVGANAADIEDKHSHRGPGVATLDAMQSVLLQSTEYLMVIPVDMPLLTSHLLKQLLNLALHYESGCYIRGNMMPLVLKMEPAFVTVAKAHFAHNDSLSLRELIALNQAAALPAEQWRSEQLLNINHPEDWQRMLA
ncbi:NTP transferase domain-containing protein [Alteromonas pelagimontana]|uniref:NTP transferase domain-containing protein n=1 Tax=Alteromonas pelagimontana TaxID=1858656 RepID=A0A6M4MCP7_9ALTE|nr:NTP transferase domain-containing protein [Alteromonas pelagimontana]QJR80335.1 NTP transferase domain-containing protein [Alteromonas pelagimontana]